MSRLIYQFFFEALGEEFRGGSPYGRQSRERARSLVGEGLCEPLRLCAAGALEAVEAGATHLVLTGLDDACYYGHFWMVIQQMLRRQTGRVVPFLVFWMDDWRDLLRQLRSFGLSLSRWRLWSLLQTIRAKIDLWEELQLRAARHRAQNPGDDWIEGWLKRYFFLLCQQEKRRALKGLRQEALASLPPWRPDPRVPRLLLIGEIFEMLEPGANHNLLQHLGALGVEAACSLNLNDLIDFRSYTWPTSSQRWCRSFLPSWSQSEERARPWVGPLAASGWGGFGHYSLGTAAWARDLGYDGLIHVHPFLCMPEVTARPLLQKICQQQQLPFLSLSLDEHESAGHLWTRLEAFVDVVRSLKASHPTDQNTHPTDQNTGEAPPRDAKDGPTDQDAHPAQERRR